jgi:hypothetical protein
MLYEVNRMADITSPRILWAKGLLFLLIGILGSTILLIEVGNVRTILLHVVSVWAFCRFYYFAFYVIEHYVDPSYRFAGLFAFLKYAWKKDGREPRS